MLKIGDLVQVGSMPIGTRYQSFGDIFTVMEYVKAGDYSTIDDSDLHTVNNPYRKCDWVVLKRASNGTYAWTEATSERIILSLPPWYPEDPDIRWRKIE